MSNQSVIGDYFPPEKRATALSVLMLSPPIGAFLGAAGGGWIGQELGWRSAFLIATVPGALLAVAAWLLIAEPPRGRYDREANGEVPSFLAVLKRLVGLASARHLLAGSTLASMVGFGLNGFITFLLVRKFAMSLAEAAFYAALLGSLPGAIAVLAGGRLADAFGASRPWLYAAIPGLCLLVTEAPAGSAARARVDAVAATLDGFELAEVDLELRGEGDVLGDAQSGARSSLRLLRVVKDADVIAEARVAAEQVLDDDPALVRHPGLAAALERRVGLEERAALAKN